MPFEFPIASDFGLERVAEVMTRGYSDYLVKISLTAPGLVQMVGTDSVDLGASHVILRDGEAVGAALVARRGSTSRLAGMSIVPEARRRGAGRGMMVRLLAEARARGDREMVLEVIEQNLPAVRLYEESGFERVRRLVGFSGRGTAGAEVAGELAEIDLREMAGMVMSEGLPDLPWQISGETMAHLAPPCVAYRLDGACVALANVKGPTVTIRGLAAERGSRQKEKAQELLRSVMARHAGKEWRVPALWPEELSDVFAGCGLKRTPLSQWHMARRLDRD